VKNAQTIAILAPPKKSAFSALKTFIGSKGHVAIALIQDIIRKKRKEFANRAKKTAVNALRSQFAVNASKTFTCNQTRKTA